jgi:hypothetical protein
MRISFRLQELLKEHHVLERGVIKRIAEAASLERHQVAAVLSNKAKYVSMDTLAAVCQYLIEHHNVDRAQLPGALFRIEPERFSALMAERTFVELCIGTWIEKKARPAEAESEEARYRRPPANGKFPRRRWVMASDSYLQGILMHELFAQGNTRHPDSVEQRLVSAYTSDVALEDLKQEAESMYHRFQDRADERALVCLGSVKSNVVIEAVVAGCFHTTTFSSQDGVKRPKDRSCPFFFRYRDDDAQPPSCHGGLRLARSKETPQPGIHYETAAGWTCAPCSRHEDAALVFYAYHVPAGRVEMVLGGFSGRATHCLAAGLPGLVSRLWPPTYDTSELQVGAFVVRFQFGDSTQEPEADELGPGWKYHPTMAKVVPLEANVLKQKLEQKGKE